MALLQTPTLISDIDSLLEEYHKEIMWSGKGITEDNFKSDPETREANARSNFSTKMGLAIEKYVENTIFYLVVGSLPTAGAPTSHVNTGIGNIKKI